MICEKIDGVTTYRLNPKHVITYLPNFGWLLNFAVNCFVNLLIVIKLCPIMKIEIIDNRNLNGKGLCKIVSEFKEDGDEVTSSINYFGKKIKQELITPINTQSKVSLVSSSILESSPALAGPKTACEIVCNTVIKKEPVASPSKFQSNSEFTPPAAAFIPINNTSSSLFETLKSDQRSNKLFTTPRFNPRAPKRFALYHQINKIEEVTQKVNAVKSPVCQTQNSIIARSSHGVEEPKFRFNSASKSILSPIEYLVTTRNPDNNSTPCHPVPSTSSQSAEQILNDYRKLHQNLQEDVIKDSDIIPLTGPKSHLFPLLDTTVTFSTKNFQRKIKKPLDQTVDSLLGQSKIVLTKAQQRHERTKRAKQRELEQNTSQEKVNGTLKNSKRKSKINYQKLSKIFNIPNIPNNIELKKTPTEWETNESEIRAKKLVKVTKKALTATKRKDKAAKREAKRKEESLKIISNWEDAIALNETRMNHISSLILMVEFTQKVTKRQVTEACTGLIEAYILPKPQKTRKFNLLFQNAESKSQSSVNLTQKFGNKISLLWPNFWITNFSQVDTKKLLIKLPMEANMADIGSLFPESICIERTVYEPGLQINGNLAVVTFSDNETLLTYFHRADDLRLSNGDIVVLLMKKSLPNEAVKVVKKRFVKLGNKKGNPSTNPGSAESQPTSQKKRKRKLRFNQTTSKRQNCGPRFVIDKFH